MRLNISPQAVTRAIAELEILINQPLFYRNTRRNLITLAGRELSMEAERVIRRVDDFFKLSATDNSDILKGVVKVTCPSALGRHHLMRALQNLLIKYPQILINLHLSDQVADVIEDGIDVGVRFGMFCDQRLVARSVGSIKFYTVAAPKLMSKFGIPQSIESLSSFPTSGLIGYGSGKIWPWYFKYGQTFTPPSPTLLTDDAEVELEAALLGLVYSQIPDFMVEKHVMMGNLMSVLDEVSPEPWGVYVYRNKNNLLSTRVRLVFDCISDYLENSLRH